MKVICPHKSIDLTKGKAYQVLKEFDFGIVEIKNDVGETITVNTPASAWTFKQPWKIVQ